MFLSCKTEIRVSAGFCLLAGWFALVNGWRLLVTILSAAAVHEFGHWLVLRAFGAKILGFRVSVLGAVLETDNRRLSYGQELAATLAGPAVNLLGAALLVGRGAEVDVGAHLVLGMFNLLPMRPLDGGRALYLVTAWLLGLEAAERISEWTGTVTAVLLAVGLGWLMIQSGGSLWLLPAALGALAAVGREVGFGK